MRTIDKFYDELRYMLFETNVYKRKELVNKMITGELKYVRLLGKLMNAWTEEFPDDYYPTDYWTEKWTVLKRVLIGKRTGETMDRITDCCLLIIGNKCDRSNFSNDEYEKVLTCWR